MKAEVVPVATLLLILNMRVTTEAMPRRASVSSHSDVPQTGLTMDRRGAIVDSKE